MVYELISPAISTLSSTILLISYAVGPLSVLYQLMDFGLQRNGDGGFRL